MNLKLHLGCGPKRMEGWVNVDFFDNRNADVTADLSKRWPWVDDSVDEIFSNHVFEHLPFGHVFTECYRILKPNGLIHFVVPYANTHVHLLNPTHITEFAWATFDSWLDAEHSNYGFPMRWAVDRRYIYFMGQGPPNPRFPWRKLINGLVNPIINTFPLLYERLFLYWLPACEIEYVIRKQPITE